MTIKECVQRCENMATNTIRYYMGCGGARYELTKKWKNRLILSIKSGAIPVESMENFVQVIAYYNKNIY